MQSLSAVALVHRPVLIAIAKSQLAGTWALNNTVEKYCVYQDYCIVAAQQASRIAAILQHDGQVPRHCWMTIFESSNACCILLFSASQKLFYSSTEGIEADFACIQNLIRLLSWCGTAEPISNPTLDTITSIYEALKTLWQLRFPHAEGHNSLRPESEEQHNYQLDKIQRETPMYQSFKSPIPRHDSSNNTLSLKDMHINDIPFVAINPLLGGRDLPVDQELSAILQQIIDFALNP